MREDLDRKLCEDFPNLYGDRHADMQSTCMCWGFPGDGWEPLIRELSAKLEALIVEWKKEYPDAEYAPRASQVKEKYGTLRFYMTSGTDAMYDLIDEAETKSEAICETCGQPGTLRTGGWWTVTCDKCQSEWEATRGYKTPLIDEIEDE